MKECTKCRTTKPLSDFGKNSHSKDGHRPDCKSCVNKQRAEWRIANPEKWAEQHARYVAKNRKKLAAKQARYRIENPEKWRSQLSAYFSKNKDRINEKRRLDRAADLELWRKKDSERYHANPLLFKIRNHIRRGRKQNNGGTLSKDIAERLFKLQRGKCACGCGEPLGDKYHMDHIMPLARGGENCDSNIQLLRATCNLQKSHKHPIDFMQQRGFLL